MIVSKPADVQEVFSKVVDAGNDELGPFLGARSPFMLKGERHLSARRAMHTALARASLEVSFADKLVARIEDHMASGSRDTPLEVFRDAALDCMLEICFSRASKRPDLHSTVRRLFEMMTGWAMFSHTGEIADETLRAALRDARDQIREAIVSTAEERRGEGYVDLALLKGAQLDALIDEVCTLLAAGSDPLAAALTWAGYYIATDEKFGDALDADLASQASNSPACAAHRAHRGYLEAVCWETLRLIPVVPVVDRLVSTPVSIGGTKMEPGDRVAACSYLTHRRADTYRAPRSFNPQRYFEGAYGPYQYYPFGGGARRCIGANLIGRLLPEGLRAFHQRYRIATAGNRRPRAVLQNVVIAPAGRMKLLRRSADAMGPVRASH